MKEKIINICGKEVGMIYCAATENGYEEIAKQSIGVFLPEFGTDGNGNTIVVEPPKAHIGDFVSLAYAGIVAYYARQKKDVPVSVEEILYKISPAERNELITSIVELRDEWYKVPEVVKPEFKPDGKKPKNV